MFALAAIATSNTPSVQAHSRSQQGPTLRQVMSLARNGSPQISADGAVVAFAVSKADWDADRNALTLWVSVGGEAPRELEAAGFGGGFSFCGDGWIAYLSGMSGMSGVSGMSSGRRGSSIRLIRPDGSGAHQIGPLPPGTRSFSCAPDGRRAAVAVREPEAEITARERALFGELDIKDEGMRRTHLWMIELDEAAAATTPTATRLTWGDFTVGSFAWSPDGSTIAFDHAPDPHPNSSFSADVSAVDVATGEMRTIASHAGRDRAPVWSPDGAQILYSSLLDVPVSNLPAELMVVPAGGGEARMLTADFETEPRVVAWNDAGIWFTADDRTQRHLYRMDPVSTTYEQVDGLPEIVRGASMSADGSMLALLGESRTMLPEIMTTRLPVRSPTILTDTTRQVEGWPLGDRQLVQWQAEDGLSIEGVLFRPQGFDPSRQYPLMVVVHGGPRAVSRPQLVAGGLYPVEHWLARGALVLMPNYRGSVGYGAAFRSAHHRTVGRGDAMDVLAGVEYLIGEGFVDEDRVALMGWSYGGFVSAYLTATSDRFHAISVGAGISHWPTHYAGEAANITTLVFSFGVPPHEDPEAWAIASPMTHIAGAQTPTLIQHVDGDPTVTVLNAYELYQALQDLGVETRFVEYHGPAHGPTGLKQRLGVLWHNQQWFARHMWGEEIELPGR